MKYALYGVLFVYRLLMKTLMMMMQGAFVPARRRAASDTKNRQELV